MVEAGNLTDMSNIEVPKATHAAGLADIDSEVLFGKNNGWQCPLSLTIHRSATRPKICETSMPEDYEVTFPT